MQGTSAPIELANEFLRDYGDEGTIDHLKLQKLTYLANGWWLALKGSPLLSERPQVWRYGPVFKSLYRTFVGRGRSIITSPARGPFGGDAPRVAWEDPEEGEALVSWIWDEYGDLTGPQLSDLTHAIGTPWQQIAMKNSYRVPSETEIPARLDWEFFSKLAAERELETADFVD